MAAYEAEGKAQYEEYTKLQSQLENVKSQEEYEALNERMAELKADYDSKENERKAANELIEKIKEENKQQQEKEEAANVDKALAYEQELVRRYIELD
jgi:predicted  nucleic acid-binding Zn-ribbon protein